MEIIESEVFGLDFINDLQPNEYLSKVTWSLVPISGFDENPDDHLIASPRIVIPDGGTLNTATIQRISGLLPGVTYRVKAVADTSLGNTKSLWSHIRGISDDT